jgi:hypothetical protein
LDFSNDDLLGEENDLSDATYDFLGVQKGNLVNVRNAATLTASAPARFTLQPTRPDGKMVSSELMVQNFTQSIGVEISETTARTGFMGQTQRSTGHRRVQIMLLRN